MATAKQMTLQEQDNRTLNEKVEDLVWAIRQKKWQVQEWWGKKSWLVKAMIVLAIAVFAVVGVFLGAYAFCDATNPYEYNTLTNGAEFKKLSGVKKVVGNFIALILTSGGDGIAEFLKFENNDLGITRSIWDNFKLFGVGMALIYFLIDLNKITVMQGTDVTMKSFYAPFAKFMLAYAFLAKGNEIISGILGFNNALIDWATSLTMNGNGGNATGLDDLWKAVGKIGFFDAIFMLILLVFIYIISLIVSLVMIYNSFTRKLEMLLRVGLTPISLGDFYNFENSTGFRYIKKLLALVIYGMCMIAIVKIGSLMQISFMTSKLASATGLFSELWQLIKVMATIVCVGLAEVGACGLAKQACNDALGV